ncbi:glycosyltransferase family 2 protein [Psychroflexus sp. ALD_RP9]|uniref:glycosyltransferase family 2 protein n=1 Tax=Psychroflexus sp. ALD_RP9 TaxID=2777186 RepID=UPI001A8E2D72|nr:glycosyltransferase family A protein [Psychroflexus sp. ALD_RP9]QSS96811.1 glycosyltransferase family 2 protein [Psychroflexus sp. ALD_RP9]
MLSILIPCYNYNVTALVQALQKQIDTLKNNVEIIVLDDGKHSYNTVNKKLSDDEHLTYLQNKTNLGRTKSRQSLAEAAQFENLLFLDADVLPVQPHFLQKYLKFLNEDFGLIYGGNSYDYQLIDSSKILHYKFGKHREAKSLKERLKNPYLNFTSQNFIIKKSVFLNLNTNQTNKYGYDLVFSYKLKQLKIQVLQIDNPVFHKGLNDNQAFLKKSLQAVTNLVEFERKAEISMTHTRLQQVYQKLINYKLTRVFNAIIYVIKPILKRNLKSSKPKLIALDLMKLQHYISLRSKDL